MSSHDGEISWSEWPGRLSPVRVNQCASLPFLASESLDSVAGTTYELFPLLDGAAGCFGARIVLTVTSCLGRANSLRPLPWARFFPASACLKPVVYRLTWHRPLAAGLPCTLLRRGGQSQSVSEGVRHQASPVLGNWLNGDAPLIPSWFFLFPRFPASSGIFPVIDLRARRSPGSVLFSPGDKFLV